MPGPVDQSELYLQVLAKLDRLLNRYVDKGAAGIDLSVSPALIWDGATHNLRSVTNPVKVDESDLVGIEHQKESVLENTRKFVAGQKSNNVLLWGERGTGKSSLIKSLLKVFGKDNLRMIQVHKHDILSLGELYGFVRANSAYRFIVFIDDLSFEESQTEYKEMKTIMDGGLEEIPENLLFYATSNRRHLIPEKFSDMTFDEIMPSDTVEEKMSLSERFGLRLGFFHISQDTYLDMVDLYAKKYGISMDVTELHRKAIQWSLSAGGRNGRIAEQFARSVRI